MQTTVKSLETSGNLVPPVTIHIPFETLLATIATLSNQQKWQIYQTLSTNFVPNSAEAKAISRLPDQDDSSKWITSIEEDEQIDEQALKAWLEKKGYQKANV